MTLVLLASAANAADFAGHFYLQNVREVGSELLLKPDGTFEYMLAYGAADYWAKGTWRAEENAVILDSGAGTPKPAFRLVRSEAKKIAGVRILVLAPNGRPVPNIDVALVDDGEPAEARTGSDGAAVLNAKRPQSVVFRVRVYRYESAPIALEPKRNEFQFEINGDEVTQVRFRGERLTVDGTALLMRYWDKDQPMRYAKQ